jgi:hypothetical protein
VIRAGLVALALAAAVPAAALEKLGVVAVADPPAGPDADLAELAHQVRAACRDRVGGVEDVPTMRARLLGQTSNATLSELDRAYGGALAVYQNGEFDSALRTLHAIVDDLESLPESADGYAQWTRAQLRLAHAALTIAREVEAEDAFYEVARTDVTIAADPDQYSPTFRRRFDAVRAKVRAMPARRLTITSEGEEGTVFVNGRAMGTTPLSLWLAPGTYRIGGASEDLRVPSFRVDLRREDRSVVLDFALAAALRVNAGPGLALPLPRRSDGIVRAGAWLGVDRVIAVSRVYEGEAAFLLGSIYDVRRGALQREGSVRMVGGGVPAANLGALAAFLLTGQSSRDVKDRTETARENVPLAAAAHRDPAPAPPPAEPEAVTPADPPVVPAPAARAERPSEPPPAAAPAAPVARAPDAGLAGAKAAAREAEPAPARDATKSDAISGDAKPSLSAAPPAIDSLDLTGSAPRAGGQGRRTWLRRGAIGSAVLATGFAALSLQQALAARSAYADADRMVQGGVLAMGSDVARYDALLDDGDAAKRNAWISAGAAVVFAATAGVLGWHAWRPDAEPTVAFRF